MLPKIIDFPKITDPRGNLTFLQYHKQFRLNYNLSYRLAVCRENNLATLCFS